MAFLFRRRRLQKAEGSEPWPNMCPCCRPTAPLAALAVCSFSSNRIIHTQMWESINQRKINDFVDLSRLLRRFCRETDRDVVGAAASLFIVSSVKVPNHTNDLIRSEMNHQLPDQRINALHRFQASATTFQQANQQVLLLYWPWKRDDVFLGSLEATFQVGFFSGQPEMEFENQRCFF